MSATSDIRPSICPQCRQVSEWEFHFVGSREIRMQFYERLAQRGLGRWSRMAQLFSQRRREEYSIAARAVVNEMLAEYAARGWELVTVVPMHVNGQRIGFEWYFKRPVAVHTITC